ncbi:MAG: hypothetical protein PHP23_07920 [Desulfobacterales bacterium]|nr:hypothetical protein [Desulfobacterales bacterium]MDD4072012.1 hypothetical protein [Desulfobacterales bacterium]MDD4393894.1 hypothetical protein [Desulfobacterales bacterium]
MKKLIEYLSSLQFCLWLLIILFGWFTWAIVLATATEHSETFRQMNNHLLLNWLSISHGKAPLIRFWFFGLCAVMAALGINLIFCTWNKFLKMTVKRMNRSAILMLMIHIVFGLVILGHFGSLVFGFRYSNVRLQQGESFTFGNGYRVIADQIHFVNDASVLSKPLKAMRSGEFSFESNSVQISVYRNEHFLKSGRLFFLKPFVLDNIQFTLRNFTPPVSTGKTGQNQPSAGTVLFISQNPVKSFVFGLFPLMIIGITAYLMMTWKQPGLFKHVSKSAGGNAK